MTQSELTEAASKKSLSESDRRKAIKLLNNARQLQIVMSTFMLDDLASGKGRRWPTNEGDTKDTIKKRLVDGNYLTDEQANKVMEHLLIGILAENAPGNTIAFATDNIPGSPIPQPDQLAADFVVVMTKGGEGNLDQVKNFKLLTQKLQIPTFAE